MSTFLVLVNDVLARLRESSVASVSTSSYSSMIGKLVNDAKRQVEDAWNWEVMNTTIPITTVSGTTNYVITGSGERHKLALVNDITNTATLQNVSLKWIQIQQQLTTVQSGNPSHYAWSGGNGTDSKVEIFPTPDGAYSLKFNLYVPQIDLSADADVLIMASEAVVASAYARALVERGEDGGLSSSEAYGLFKGILADQISLESSRNHENECWVAN